MLKRLKEVLRRFDEALSSSELKNRVMALGLDPSGKSVTQLENILAMAIFAQRNPGKTFPDQYSPMLAKDATKADKAWVQGLKDKDYIIQLKANGMRSVLSLVGNDLVMTSRTKSVDDLMFIPHQDKVLGFQKLKNPFKGKTVIDGELYSPNACIDTGATITSSPLQAAVAMVHAEQSKSFEMQKRYGSLAYHAFDILFFDGEDVQKLPYEKRLDLLTTAIGIIQGSNPEAPISLIPTVATFTDAYAVWQDFLDKGHEGVMLKLRSGKYAQDARSGDLLKLKGYIGVDGFISGSVPATKGKGFDGMIGGFEISAYVDGKERIIAAVSNITLDVRKAATIQGPNGPELNPEFLGRCVEVEGQEWSKGGRIGSARITEWRPDKNPTDCQLTSDETKPKDWKGAHKDESFDEYVSGGIDWSEPQEDDNASLDGKYKDFKVRVTWNGMYGQYQGWVEGKVVVSDKKRGECIKKIKNHINRI